MTSSTTSKHAVASLLVGLAFAASACGDDAADNDNPGVADAKPKAAKVADVDLTPMLMQRGEVPGFRPGALPGAMPRSRATFTGVKAFAAEMGLPPAEVRRLTGEGFLSFTVGPIQGPRGTAGLTNVALYKTAAGAKQSMANDLRPDVIRGFGPIKGLRFFDVPGVPGARGWTATEPRVANVLWVQDRCYFTLGGQGPGRLSDLLASGARAMNERTAGRCA